MFRGIWEVVWHNYLVLITSCDNNTVVVYGIGIVFYSSTDVQYSGGILK